MEKKKVSRYRDLKAKLEALQKEVQEARIEETREAISTCLELIAEFELSPYDLGFVKTQIVPPAKVKKAEATFAVKKPKVPSPPKYIDPKSGKTWSGRGHQPGWIVGNRDEYLIKTGEKSKRVTQNNKAAA
jgi:DNA-binding protein H-NS